MSESLLVVLLRTTLCTTVAASLTMLFLRYMRIDSPKIRRVAAVLVLLQGWAILPLTIEYVAQRASVDSIMLSESVLAGPNAPPPELISDDRTSYLESALSLVLAVWIGGAMFMVARYVWRYASLLRSLPRSSSTNSNPAHQLWDDQWSRLAGNGKQQAKCQFLVTNTLGPLLLCLVPFRYLVLVPEHLWTELDATQRESILRHELAHLSRHDLWKSVGIRLLALPQWFNPLAWKTVQAFDEAAEWACDDLIMSHHDVAVRRAYPTALLRIAESNVQPPSGSVAAGGGVLSRRIRRLVQPHFKDKKMVRLFVPMMLVGLAIIQTVRVEAVVADDKTEVANTLATEAIALNELPQTGSQIILKMTSDLAKEYWKAGRKSLDPERGVPVQGADKVIRNQAKELPDAPEGLQISTGGRVTRILKDGRYRIDTPMVRWNSTNEERLIKLTVLVDPAKFQRMVTPIGTKIYSHPGASGPTTTKQKQTGWKLELSDSKDATITTYLRVAEVKNGVTTVQK